MKKTAIIGIGIAIVIAGIVGIYAASTTQEGETAKESELGLGDEASITVKQPKDEEKIGLGNEEKLGLGDKAGATVENPEDEEKLGLEDKAGATVEEPKNEEKIGLKDKAAGTAENP